MSHFDESANELHELLSALCDGQIRKDQFQRLEELVCEDPQSRWRYVRYLNLHANLSRHVQIDMDDLTLPRVDTEPTPQELALAATENHEFESDQKDLATKTNSSNRGWSTNLKVAYLAAAVVILFFLVTADSFLPRNSVSSQAFATVLQQLHSASVISYIAEFQEGGAIIRTVEAMHLQPDLVREESPDGQIRIIDLSKRRSITIDPNAQRAVVLREVNVVRTYKQERFLDKIREYIERIRTNPLSTDRYLGVQKIDGRTAEGYEMRKPTQVQTLWVDVESGLLTQMEIAAPDDPGCSLVMRNFRFEVESHESLFSVEPPQGYDVSYETMESNLQVDDKVKMIPR
jgi:outer membrane lipoprotein-sorting protein